MLHAGQRSLRTCPERNLCAWRISCAGPSRDPSTDLRQAFREHIRLQAAELFAAGHDSAAVAKDLRVSVRSAQRWRRAWEQGGERALASKGPASRAPPAPWPASCRTSGPCATWSSPRRTYSLSRRYPRSCSS
ncbi:helix-turn-helix domain-containing protein [Streptomyces sporangiiformans]|uniref:Helix-turn-helix domain-containing protein n=1 Tax=Streptomyces sporangiiformans TaxID=2315329 RepID=A0A505D6X3_9ACTN|nr:helix-turn-helix domain-containing protein [Streptomyces sporangiiformans]TPQ18330.1 helix-turn-helix domain-containing protein [Streptomyces sporangiiformans]